VRSIRLIPCGVCRSPVKVANRQRFLELKRIGESPLCEQCRRYVSPRVARMTEVQDEYQSAPLALRKRIGKRAKKSSALAKLRVGRCVARGCGDGV